MKDKLLSLIIGVGIASPFVTLFLIFNNLKLTIEDKINNLHPKAVIVTQFDKTHCRVKIDGHDYMATYTHTSGHYNWIYVPCPE